MLSSLENERRKKEKAGTGVSSAIVEVIQSNFITMLTK